MNTIKLNAKKKKKMKKNWRLVQIVRIFSQDIGMEYGTEKCAMLIMKNGNRETTEETILPNKKNVRTLREKENDKDLEILKADQLYSNEKSVIFNRKAC